MYIVMQSGGGEVNGLTLGYNVARLHEANGESKQAQTFYTVCQPSYWLHGCIYIPCCLLFTPVLVMCSSDCLCIRNCHCSDCALPCWNCIGAHMHASQENLLGLSDVSVSRRINMQDIVSDFPDYLDAYMRLACIERKQGNLKKAIEWAEKGVDRAEACSKGSSSHSDLLAMTGQFCGVCQCV